jgi:hypothetical protein
MPAGPRHSQNSVLQQLEQLSHHEICLAWAETVGAADEYCQGPGGIKGDGYPMPVAGFLRFIAGYSTGGTGGGNSPIYIPTANLFTFVAGDRISCYWDWDGATYGTAWIRKNGASWSVAGQYAQVGNFISGDLFVTVVLRLHKTIT